MSSYILVHGGAHVGACWEPVTLALRAAGHQVQAVDLPGRAATADQAGTATLEDWALCLSAALDQAGRPAVLVAHSMGGLSATIIASRRPGDIERLVYVSAIVPQEGDAGLALLQTAGPDCVLLEEGAIVPAADGATATVPGEFARRAFYQRCTDEQARAAIAQLCPEPLAPLMTPVVLGAGLASVNRIYLGATEDRAVPPAFQRTLAENAAIEHVAVTGDHSLFLSATDALISHLTRAAD